jgi:opacity protein-like surface antigen
MRKSLLVIGAVLLSALVVSADNDSPKYEAFAGYNFVRFNPASTAFIPSFNANGGNGQFVYNVWQNFGVVLDIGAVTKGTLNHLNIDSTALNFVAGPRYTLHLHESRFQPFVQALFGGVYATSSTHLDILGGTIVSPHIFQPINTITSPITARLVESRTGFAMLAGGGLDYKINKHMSIRPIGADYYLTRLPDFLTQNLPGHHHHNANNFRYSAGVNFTFGKE